MILSKNINDWVFSFIFIALSYTSLPNSDVSSGGTGIQYVLLFSYLTYFISFNWMNKEVYAGLKITIIDAIPSIYIGVWIYGLFIGFFYGIESKFLFRNFAGMLLYFAYYIFLLQRVALSTIKKTIVFTSIFGIPIILFFVGRVILGSIGDLLIGERFIFCGLQLIIFIPFCVLVGNLFFPIDLKSTIFYFKSKLWLFLIFLVSFVTSVILSMSKGMILGAIATFLILLFSRIIKGLSIKMIVTILTAVTSICLILAYFDLFSTLSFLFSNQEASNSTRDEQLSYIVNDLRFLGNGLGSGLRNSYYTRADEAPYAFELSYVNLIHKFGIMAVLLFYSYFYTFLQIFRALGNDKASNLNALFALGLMIFIFPSIGNPFIFSPLCVVCHSLALYILKINKQCHSQIP